MTVSRRLGYQSSVLFLAVVSLAIAGYMLLRFNGMFASHDTAVYTRVAASIKQTGSLTAGVTYSNGFGYSAFVALLSTYTGVSVASLQLYVVPFLLVLPVVGAYVAFREMLDTRRGLFAALLLLVHPFFLFSAFRSTHEKFTYLFILLSLYALYVSFAERNELTKSRFIILGYLLILGITFLNVYFASSFIVAVLFSLFVTFVLSRYYGQVLRLRRLGYTLGVSFALLIVVVFFLYPPARAFLRAFDAVTTQTLFLLLGNAPSAIAGGPSPYDSIFTRWNSFRLYLVLISFYFVVYPIAGLSWLSHVRRYLSEQSLDHDQVPNLFVLILAAAFGIQLILAMVADQTGLLGANMQLRVFPIFGFLVVVLATRAVFRLLNRTTESSSLMAINGGAEFGSISSRIRENSRELLPLLVIVLLVGFTVTGAVKATTDPAVSTGWIVTTEAEQAGMAWTETNMQEEYIWVGYTGRLQSGHLMRDPDEGLRNTYEPGAIGLVAQYLIVTDITVKQAEVGGFPLPPRTDASRIYSNGEMRLFWFEHYRTFDEYNDAFRRSQRNR